MDSLKRNFGFFRERLLLRTGLHNSMGSFAMMSGILVGTVMIGVAVYQMTSFRNLLAEKKLI